MDIMVPSLSSNTEKVLVNYVFKAVRQYHFASKRFVTYS